MVYAVLYIENGDVVGTYPSLDDARQVLSGLVAKAPRMRDEVGIRAYDGGRPVGDFRPASEVLAGVLPQEQFAIGISEAVTTGSVKVTTHGPEGPIRRRLLGRS